MVKQLDPRIAEAIAHAVHAAILSCGINAVRNLSMFPSSSAKQQKLAA